MSSRGSRYFVFCHGRHYVRVPCSFICLRSANQMTGVRVVLFIVLSCRELSSRLIAVYVVVVVVVIE